MRTHRSQRLVTAALFALAAAIAGGAEPQPWTIFAFDDYSIPFKKNLFLTMAAAEKYARNPVVRRGPAGSPDSYRAQFYGSVIRVGETFRMWYTACSFDPGKGRGSWAGNPGYDDTWRVAYAESTDGLHWTKPDLGLTAFNGNQHTNLVRLPDEIDSALINPLAVFVLHEPNDPDPSHRYKMALYGKYYNSDPAKKRKTSVTIYPLWSADGLRWKLAGPAPKAKAYDEKEAPFTTEHVFEIGGFYKFDGIYYVTGQQITPDTTLPNGDPVGRTMVTHWSGDFVHWSEESSFSFQRYGYRSAKVSSVEEAHEGASIWNRGNVLLGLFGLWHGSPEQRRWRLDLGLIVSNDGVHFREPVPDHVFLKAGSDGDWDKHGLIQGQGFVNVDSKTYIYFGTWDPSVGQVTPGEIGLAMVERDRLGYLATRWPGEGSFITSPIRPPRGGASLSLNAEGLSEDAYLGVELIDKLGAPVRGFSGTAAAKVKSSGLAEKVVWPQSGASSLPEQPFRLHVRFLGKSPQKIRLYAAYVNRTQTEQER